MKKCGLIGQTLSHSYSPQIHEYLNQYLPDEKKYSYNLLELSPDSVADYLANGDFYAMNVTIPYKQTVVPHCAEISDTAKKIGSVNTITRRADGGLRGDNTDYYGFCYMLDTSKIDISGKKVLILGSGGSSLTAQAAVADMGASATVVISRSGENNYLNLQHHADADVIINTTPLGMYPNNGVSPIELDIFSNLSGVADIIYNPSKTKLLLDSDERGITNTNGLPMLVAQAKSATEIFASCKIDDSAIDEITQKLEFQMKNIILIGMPGSGKSTVGKFLADKLNRDFIDTDEIIEAKANKRIPEIFVESGEDFFRELETDAIDKAGKQSSCIIATGGGIVTQARNLPRLIQNATVVFLDRPIEDLPTDNRPLSMKASLPLMYEKRLPLYEKAAHIKVKVQQNPEETAAEIITILLSGSMKTSAKM